MITGDFVFVGDLGRPDLLESAAGQAGAMEPSARTLYRSVQDFLALPDYLQVWPAHGAGSACGKALGAVPKSSVGYERRFNASILAASRGEDAFVEAILEGQPEPPMYFARMKHDNKMGPAVLGVLPQPKRLSPAELGALSGRTDVAVIDTRRNRMAFMKGHLANSLYAPFNKTFNTIVGSYVEAGMPLYLIIDEADVGEAVRDLVRIGLDDIVGYAIPADLAAWAEAGGELAQIEVIDFAEVAARRTAGDSVFDVRRLAEFNAGHVPGAQNIAHTRLWARRDEVPANETLLVHCKSGARASTAVALLARQGHTVALVNDAFAVWAAKEEVATGAEALPA